MHHGIYIGNNVANKTKRILILGESHHISKTDKENMELGTPATYTTEQIVKGYISNGANTKETQSLKFFEKIGNSFNSRMETQSDREAFWSNVCFGNYIDVLCGIKDGKAATILKIENEGIKNRQKYNDDLFKFVNDNEIDIVVCFGRLVFDNLPSLNKKHFAEENDKDRIKIIKSNVEIDYIGKCVYLPDITHKHTSIALNRRIEVYGLKHPSAYGFNPKNYVEVLKELL